MWVSAVRWEMTRAAEISLLLRPRATSSATSRSRRVSPVRKSSLAAAGAVGWLPEGVDDGVLSGHRLSFVDVLVEGRASEGVPRLLLAGTVVADQVRVGGGRRAGVGKKVSAAPSSVAAVRCRCRLAETQVGTSSAHPAPYRPLTPCSRVNRRESSIFWPASWLAPRRSRRKATSTAGTPAYPG